MKLEDRQRGLLNLVAEYRERECRRLLDEADAQARELLRQTYRRERAHLHARVVAERSRAQARIQAARAERATRDRWASERSSAELLAAAWPRLREILRSRWLDPVHRRRWVSGYLRRGQAVLPLGMWTVRHAPEWGEDERAGDAEMLARALRHPPRFETDGDMEAGLIIASEGAVLDASLDGLLRDRPRLEARLLALLEKGGGA